jgi:hypothetical protein
MERCTLAVAALLAALPALAASAATRNDFDGDGRSDLLWRNAENGFDVIWPNAASAAARNIQRVSNLDWQIAGSGDFDGDLHADILWRNRSSGAMVIWYAGSSDRRQEVRFDWGVLIDTSDWDIASIGDFDGDQVSDILWRNRANGRNAIGFLVSNDIEEDYWYAYYTNPVVRSAWKVVGTGDFDGDGHSDVLWRNGSTGANVVWRFTDPDSSMAFVSTELPTVSALWNVAGVGDFDGDGQSDVLWRHPVTGANVVWPSAMRTSRWTPSAAGTAWAPASIADINGDRHSDIVWRNTTTGANMAWLSANIAAPVWLTAVIHQTWKIAP